MTPRMTAAPVPTTPGTETSSESAASRLSVTNAAAADVAGAFTTGGLPVVTRSANDRKKHSPAAAIINLVAHRELIKNLVLRDVKARYKQSALGISWAVLNPLLFSIIQTLILIYVLKQNNPGGIPAPVFAYFGTLVWNLFSTGLSGASESLVSNLNLITKIYFPREVFPFAAVAGKLVDFLFGLAGLLPLMLIFHVVPSVTIVAVAPLLVIQILFTTGLGLLFACANLFYRDVRHLIGLMITLWFYTIPVLYPLEKVPAHLRGWYLLNPMAILVDTGRRLAFQNGQGIHWPYLGLAAAVSLVAFFAGYAVFKTREPRFAEAV